MPTIAIVGAGPGLGLSIAKVFGRNGFEVALVSRNSERLDALVADLAESDITAQSFPADVTDRPALTAALGNARARFGHVDVLEYSPLGALAMVNPLEVTVENLQSEIEHQLYGAVTTTHAVLPAMLENQSGTLLYTTGGGAIDPYPMLASVNAAQAALRNWARNLHGVLKDQGVHVAHVAINAAIAAIAPGEGIPHVAPDAIVAHHWELHANRDRFDHVVNC